MAVETPSETEFEEVSRLKGAAFKYLSFVASFAGVVSLAILLVYVAVDAFGLEAADPAWFLIYLVTFVLPAVAVAGYGLRNRPVGAVSVGVLFRVFVGVSVGLAVIVLFVIFDLQMWLLAYTLGLLPAAAVVGYGRLRNRPQANLVAMVVGVVGLAAAVYLKGPLAVYPVDWLVYVWTLGVPLAAYFGIRSWSASRERALVAAGGTLAVAVAAAFVAPLVGFGSATGVVFALTFVVPTGAYVGRVVTDDRPVGGLVLPFVPVAGALLGAVLVDALSVAQPDPWLDWQYVTSAPSQLFPEQAGLYPAIVGSVFVITNVAVLTLALGVGTAIYLEEYAASSGPLGTVTRIVQVNISNLAGVPSVVYGLLGLGLFVNFLGLGIGIVLVASATLALLILPIVIISAQEAIRSVPNELRQASYGMGATRWQTVRNVVLPEALPGILTGTILALGRAIGETAPLIMIGAATTTFSTPTGYFDSISAMPLQIFAWSSQPNPAYRYGVVAAGVVTLLAVLLTMNSVAILVRNNYQNER